MIDIAPKALRFARLAAEQQSALADDPQIALIRRQEASFQLQRTGERVRRYVVISETTAEFCIRAMTAFLENPGRFQSSEWDGNDFAFLQAATKSLREQLTSSIAQSH